MAEQGVRKRRTHHDLGLLANVALPRETDHVHGEVGWETGESLC